MMQSLRRRIAIGLLAAWALATPAAAQSTGEIDGTRLTHLVDVDGAAQASVTITGTFSGTITFKVQHRNRAPVVVDCFTPAAPTTAVNSTTGTGSWSCPVAGFHFLEVQFSSFSSGSAVIYADTSNGGPAVVGGAGGAGFDGVLVDAAGGDPVTDTVNDAIRVNVVAGGAGGGAVTNAGTFLVQENGAALTALQLIDNAVSGAGFNITQLGGAAIPMLTSQADNLALTTDALAVAAIMYCYSGTDLDLCPVAVGGSGAVDANTTRVVIATDDPVNDMAVLFAANLVASDAADAGSPLKIGFRAESSVSGRTAVADNDRVDAVAGLDGVIITRPHANLEDRVQQAPVGITDGSSTQVVAAQGAGIRYCATSITVSNSSATNVTVDIRDGTAGSVLWTFPAAANMGGATHQFETPLCTTANTIFAADPSASATTVTISTNGFKTVL